MLRMSIQSSPVVSVYAVTMCTVLIDSRQHIATHWLPSQASKFVKIHGSKLLLPSLRAGSKTIFVVANLWGFERPRPIHGSYSGSVRPQEC